MGCRGKTIKSLIVVVLVLGFLSISCQHITDGEEIKLVKFADSYIKGEYIGMIEASISQENKNKNPKNYLEQNVVNSYPLLINNDKLILAADVTLQKAVITKKMPGKIITFMVNYDWTRSENDEAIKNIYFIYLICKTDSINKLICVSIKTATNDKLEIPSRFNEVFAINTPCDKLIACDSITYDKHDLIVCQDNKNNMIYLYDKNGEFYKSVSLGKPMQLNTQYDSKMIDIDFVPFTYDGKNIIRYKQYEDSKDHLNYYILPYSEVDSSFSLTTNNVTANSGFLKPSLFNDSSLIDPFVVFADDNELFFLPKYTDSVTKMIDLKNCTPCTISYCIGQSGLFDVNYMDSSATLIMPVSTNQSLKCLGKYFLYTYFNLNDNNNNILVSTTHNFNEEKISKSKAYKNKFQNYIAGNTYDLTTEKQGLNQVECFFTENEVYIKQ